MLRKNLGNVLEAKSKANCFFFLFLIRIKWLQYVKRKFPHFSLQGKKGLQGVQGVMGLPGPQVRLEL